MFTKKTQVFIQNSAGIVRFKKLKKHCPFIRRLLSSLLTVVSKFWVSWPNSKKKISSALVKGRIRLYFFIFVLRLQRKKSKISYLLTARKFLRKQLPKRKKKRGQMTKKREGTKE